MACSTEQQRISGLRMWAPCLRWFRRRKASLEGSSALRVETPRFAGGLVNLSGVATGGFRRYLRIVKFVAGFEQTCGGQLAVVCRAGMAIVVGGNLSIEPGGVHRIDHGVEDHQVEV